MEGRKPLYEVVYEKDAGEVTHLRTGKDAQPAFPYAADFQSEEGDATRRDELASWMTSPDNEYFAKSYVNRIWLLDGAISSRSMISSRQSCLQPRASGVADR